MESLVEQMDLDDSSDRAESQQQAREPDHACEGRPAVMEDEDDVSVSSGAHGNCGGSSDQHSS